MATPEQMEKKRTRQIGEILAAVQGLTVMVTELKAKESETIELTAELDEIPDRTGEILAAIKTAVQSMADEMASMKVEIAGLKEQITPAMPAPASRRTKR